MTTKEEIKDAIKARIERFNKLWFKALGYTFEEEPEIERVKYEDKMQEWEEVYNPRLQARCKELGYENDDEYLKACWDRERDNWELYNERDPEIQALWDKHPSAPSPLYNYEMSVINEAENIAHWFLDNYPGKELEMWDTFAKGKSAFEFVDEIKNAGYDKWNDGHSGNSGSMAVSFAYTLLFQTELFPYMHGALCYMVGDKGYYDDREDVHAAVEAFKAKHPDAK